MIARSRIAYRQASVRRQYFRYRDVGGAGLQGQIGGRVTRWHTSWYPWPVKRWSAVAYSMLQHSLSQVTWVNFGEILRSHDPTDYSGTKVHFFEAVLRGTGGVAAYARLFNISDNEAVPGSVVSTPNVTATRVRSSALPFPTTEKVYRAQLGSVP